MVCKYLPWIIDVDIVGTKKLYQENDYSLDKSWNKIFIDKLNEFQYVFFDKLGIDLMKVEVERHDFEEHPEIPYMLSINILFCGKFLAMPSEQLEIYKDEELYGTCIEIDNVESIPTDDLAAYEELNLGTGIRFKHPVSHFEGSQFEKWNCGFVNAALILRG
ncbi:hypothetical protein ACTQ3U_02350 [Oscillospiraceae bacterium LCP25S3_F9]